MRMKYLNRSRAAAWVMTWILGTGVCLSQVQTIWAGSPSFARTDEEWKKLQDNNLEYEEIADLIHEYNATVYSNQIALADFKKDYGLTKEDAADEYRELAEEIRDDLDYPDREDSDYASRMAAAIAAENTADNYEKMADDNMQDSTVLRYGYQQTEATLVQQAQLNMFTYYQDQLSLEQAQLNKEQSALAMESVSSQNRHGLAVETDVQVAQETIMTTDQAIQDKEDAIKQIFQKLCVMLGWKYSDVPVIGELPELDLNKIETLNPEQDMARALENNYTLLMNQRQLENANSENQRSDMQKIIKSNKDNIGTSLTNAYQNVRAYQTAYELAKVDAEIEQKNLNVMKQKYNLGTVGLMEYKNEEITARLKEIAVKQAELALQVSMINYDWNVQGLASAS